MKKKAIKIAAASAVAASAFVAAAPANTDAASNVKTEVSLAVAQMNKAYHTYSDVTATGQFADINEVYKEYNAAKVAYNKAKDLATAAGGAQKEAYLAQLDTTYNEMIAKRVVTYIDAYKYATVNLQANSTALKAAIEGKKLAEAEVLYHEISKQLKTRTVILDRVYGQTTRDLFRNGLKKEAQTLRDSLVNDVTVSMKLVAADAAVKAGKFEDAKTALDAVKTLLPNLSAAFKAELEAKNTAVVAAYEATQTAKVESATVTDVNKVTVKFNMVVDPAKVKVELKQGSATRYTTVKWAEDKKSVVLEAPTALPVGDYTAVATPEGKAAISTPVKVEAETVKALEVVTNEVVDGSAAAPITFKVLNQYGTAMDVKGSNSEVVVTAYNVTQNKIVDKVATANTSTKSEFGLVLNASADDVKVGDEIRVILTYKGVNVTKNIKVIATSTVADVAFGALVLPDKAVRFQPGQNSVKLPVTLKDQFGKDLKLTAGMLGTDVVVTSSNSTKAEVNTTTSVDADGNLLVDLKAAGTVVFTIVAPKTGKVATTTLTINELPAPTSVTISSPTKLVAAGESVSLDVASLDQYGSKSNFAGVTFSYKIGNGSATTVTPVDGKVTFTAASAGDLVLTAVDSNSKELSRVAFKVEAAASPTSITSVDAPAVFEKGATKTVEASALKLKDQYGRDYTLKQTDNVTLGYKDTATGATREVTFTVNDVANTTGTDVAGQLDGNDTITFTGDVTAAGSEVIKLTVNNAPFELALSSIASSDITSYSLTAVPTLFAAKGSDFSVAHAQTLELVGKTAAGKEVVLVGNKISNVTSNNATVATVNLDSATHEAKVLGQSKGTATVAVWNAGTKLAETTVTVSEDTKVATTAKFAKASYTVAAGTDTQSVAGDLSVKDQYGVAIQDAGFYASSDSSIATVSSTGVVTRVTGKTGTVTITYVTSNGLIATTTVRFN